MSEVVTKNPHELEFRVLETMRLLGQLATEASERSEEFMAMIDMLWPFANSFNAPTGQILEVTTKDPEDNRPLRIEVDDTYGDEGRIWFPPAGTFSYEDTITRRENGQPVFRGQLYTFERYGSRFKIYDIINEAVVHLTPNLSVDLVDEEPYIEPMQLFILPKF